MMRGGLRDKNAIYFELGYKFTTHWRADLKSSFDVEDVGLNQLQELTIDLPLPLQKPDPLLKWEDKRKRLQFAKQPFG